LIRLELRFASFRFWLSLSRFESWPGSCDAKRCGPVQTSAGPVHFNRLRRKLPRTE
jgi:hypothetical protein